MPAANPQPLLNPPPGPQFDAPGFERESLRAFGEWYADVRFVLGDEPLDDHRAAYESGWADAVGHKATIDFPDISQDRVAASLMRRKLEDASLHLRRLCRVSAGRPEAIAAAEWLTRNGLAWKSLKADAAAPAEVAVTTTITSLQEAAPSAPAEPEMEVLA